MQPDTGIRSAWGRAWPALLAVGTVGAVGLPAAVASYRHARDVIAAHGDPVMAPWLPLSVDGMLVAALVVIWVRRHRGDRPGAFPWLAFGFGMIVTLMANLAAATDPGPVGYAVAIFPPLALGITLELVALIAYRSGRRNTMPEPFANVPTEGVGDEPTEPIMIGCLHEVDPGGRWADAPAIEDSHALAGASEPEGTASGDDGQDFDEDGDPRVVDLARRLAVGEELTGKAIGEEYGISDRQGRRLVRKATGLHRDAGTDSNRRTLVAAGSDA